MATNVYLKRGRVYTQTEGSFQIIPTLDDGIYELNQNPMTGEMFLVYLSDKFNFNFKLYGLDESLVTHVLDTYNKQESKKNIGILLNGTKGTGKTVTAKYLCNRLGLPVILINKPLNGLAEFLASIEHDCIFFFDEFEKNFKAYDNNDCEYESGESLLSIMDGVYNNEFCHIFLLTTNKLNINDNLLNRPSRIRYLKHFEDVINRDVLNEFIDDNLKYPEYKEEIIDYFETLNIGTIDILKSIVEEINIHKCSISEFKKIFNVEEHKYIYYIKSYEYAKNQYDNEEEIINKVIDTVKMEEEDNRFRDNLLDLSFKQIRAKKNEDNENKYVYLDDMVLKLEKSIQKYKIGDILQDRFCVDKIYLDKNILFCHDLTRIDYSNRVFYIENVDEKPNLYDNKNKIRYNGW